MRDQSLDSPFRRSVVIWLAGLGAASLALAVLVLQPQGAEVTSSGADAFSRSALGHRAFVELLRASGVPVLVSRYASAERAGGSALLIIAEPRIDSAESPRARRLSAMLGSTHTTLLVLPKWVGRESAEHRGWIESAQLLPADRLAATLGAAGLSASAVRPAGTGACGASTPAFWRHPQLLAPTSSALRPIIACEGGVLLGEMTTKQGGRLFVLSDPELLSNRGLAQGDNARLALDLIGRVRSTQQAVVVDETQHGFERPPSLWRELLAFPLLPASVQGVLALLALVWSGLARFGEPVPVAPTQASGRTLLIENTAALLASAGHSAHSLGRYFEATVADLGRALHAPRSATGSRLVAWLGDASRRRGARRDVTRIEAQIAQLRRQDRPSPTAILAAARWIHRWKKEMLRGPQDHPEH